MVNVPVTEPHHGLDEAARVGLEPAVAGRLDQAHHARLPEDLRTGLAQPPLFGGNRRLAAKLSAGVA
jgi:hypothetical protein